MKKLSLTIAIATLCVSGLQAQQSLRFSNYLFNKMIVNPAAAGSNDYVEVMGSYRKQWSGFQGSPQTTFLSVDGSAFDKQVGLGLQVVNEQIGALTQTGVVSNMAARVRLAETRWLSVGLSAGLFRNVLSANDLIFRDQNETIIPQANRPLNLLDFKAGLYYKDLSNFAGVSVFNIFEPKLNYSETNKGVLKRYYYFLAGHVFVLNQDFAAVPSLLFKSNFDGEQQLDINAKLAYQNKFALGLAYRNKESVGILAEYIYNNVWRFGYSFDFNTNELAKYTNGSHEVMLAYRIIRNKEILENPRFFYNN